MSDRVEREVEREVERDVEPPAVDMLVVGLGNPGPRYARTRHNVGFLVLRALAEAADASFEERLAGRLARVRLEGREVVLVEPRTFMNRSGDCVAPVMEAFDVPLERVLVVHDELDLPFETLRLKRGGGTGGHRGLASIAERCGGLDFARLRIGIGRPPEGVSVMDWVLGDFHEEAGAALASVLLDATRAVRSVLTEGLSAAMNTVNARQLRNPDLTSGPEIPDPSSLRPRVGAPDREEP